MLGETLQDCRGVDMVQVEVDVRMSRLLHLADNGQTDHISRRKLAARIIVGHEAAAVAIHQPGTLAPNSLAYQARVPPAI